MRRPGLWVANGHPTNISQMLSWKPGAIACFFDYLAANDVFKYKAANPTVPVIVRFPHPQLWRQNPEESARQLGNFVAEKWAELKSLDPYVYFAGHMNMHYANGDPDPANQPHYTTPEFYKKYAGWVRATADVIKQVAPEMKLVTPPFAYGFNEDGSPDSDGDPIKEWAGFDYLWETVRDYFDSTLTFHAYWGYANGGSVPDWLYEPELSSWYAFRWRRILKLFERRYGLNAKLIIDEAASFGPADPDFTEQLIYFAQECLSDERVLALTYFLWEDSAGNPIFKPNAWVRGIPNLAQHLERLANMAFVGGEDSIYTGDNATDLSGIMDFAAEPAPPPLLEDTAAATEPTLRVLFEDGAVRVMTIEDYLRSVVPGEMPALWPMEALKSQAVASRTYAQFSTEHSRHQPEADICTTTHCQHYDESKIHERADEAIQSTKGLILRHNGETANTVFSARCGGHTKNNEDVWHGRALPYLRGVSCPDMGEKFGHGIGFCQHGGRVFAEQGRTFDEILGHYYQATTLEPLTDK